MNALIKFMLTLALMFASTFLIAKSTGFLNIESVKSLLTSAQQVSVWSIAGVIVALLFADLFIAVPTLTIILLAGYFLGPVNGFTAAIFGLYTAGIGGYVLSRIYGDRLLSVVIRDKKKQNEARNTFLKHGFVMILLSRALPILPEVSACMAGLTRMSFSKFFLAWSISTVPYALIAVYAGSISSVENPKPAIYAALGLSALFWTLWIAYQRKNRT